MRGQRKVPDSRAALERSFQAWLDSLDTKRPVLPEPPVSGVVLQP